MPPKRALWSEDDLVSAVRAVQKGTLSSYKAAVKYGVPRRTIRNHLQSDNLKKSLGRKALLNKEQESDLVKNITRYGEIDLPVTSRILRQLCYEFCQLKGIKHNFNTNDKLVGKDWFKSFMNRHPEISRLKSQFTYSGKRRKQSEFVVNDQFAQLNKIYDELDLESPTEKGYKDGWLSNNRPLNDTPTNNASD